jgi:hypothetical protein
MTSPISACYADFGLTSTSDLFYCAELIDTGVGVGAGDVAGGVAADVERMEAMDDAAMKELMLRHAQHSRGRGRGGVHRHNDVGSGKHKSQQSSCSSSNVHREEDCIGPRGGEKTIKFRCHFSSTSFCFIAFSGVS